MKKDIESGKNRANENATEVFADTMIRKLARGRMRYGSLDRYTTEIDGRKYDNAYLSCLIEQDQRRREEEYRKEAEMEAKGHYVADTMERKLERGHKRYGSRDMTFIYVGYGRYDANYLRNLIENDEKRREEEEKARHTEECNEMPEIDDYFLDSTENISKAELAKVLKELWENQRSWVKEQIPFDTLLEEVLSIYENDAEFERKHPRDWRGRFIEKVKDFLRRIFGLVKKKKPKVEEELWKSDDGKTHISGALNPYSERADPHAEIYYEEIRHRKDDVYKISKTTGYTVEQIQRIKNYLFIDKHQLATGFKRFSASYQISESWRRLALGKPESHDITMINHEIMEMALVDKGMSQYEAHKEASKKYNYPKEAKEFYDKIGKHNPKG